MGWLLDNGNPGLRQHETFWRGHPRLLARHVGLEVEAALTALRRGYGTARVDMRADGFDPHTVEQMLAVYAAEGERLRALRGQVQLVTDGLGGVRWRPGIARPEPGDGVEQDPDFRRAQSEEPTRQPPRLNPGRGRRRGGMG